MELGKKYLPLHLLLHKVLVWLPVVSLLRFKAVCKSWRHLIIQSPFFIHLHTPITLNSSSSSTKFGSFIVHVNRFIPPPNSSSNNYQIKKDALMMLSSPYQPMSGGGESGDEVVVDDLGFDMYMKTIVGSCNGLVCIQDRSITSHSESEPIVVSLWNPAAGQGINLPESIPIPVGIFSFFVFGFDVETKDDYKVVRFTSLKPRWDNENERLESCFCGVQVYSLITNSWRLLEGIPCLPGYPFHYRQSVVYLNGTCFFLAHFFYSRRYPCLDLNDRFIISFDFTKEIITPIQLPDHHRDQDLCLCSLGGDKIALFTSTNPDDARIRSCQDFNIWVLNYERGSSVNKKSWKKLHSFQLQLESPVQWKWYTPSGISNDGKFALLATGFGSKMNLYNFATKEVKSNFLSCCQLMSKAHAYKPSLVSDIGGDGAGWRKLSFRHRWKWCRVEDRVMWCRVEEEEEEEQQDRVIENSATNL